MELAELLWETLAVYRDHGGAKRTLRARDGTVCLVGALIEAEINLYVRQREILGREAQYRLCSMANEMFPPSNGGFGGEWVFAHCFNDYPSTTKEMCEVVIEKAAIKAGEVV